MLNEKVTVAKIKEGGQEWETYKPTSAYKYQKVMAYTQAILHRLRAFAKKGTPDGNIYAFDLISLAFKVGFGLGKQYETDKKI